MINELKDPWSLNNRIRKFVTKILIKLNILKQVLLNPKKKFLLPFKRLKRALINPEKILNFVTLKIRTKLNSNVLPPMLDYTEGNKHIEYQKRALITYVAFPFYSNPSTFVAGHTNGYQSIEIAKAFNRLGYKVDIVDYMDSKFIPARKYDAFFGMHYNFGRFMPYFQKSTTTIYYATGTYWAFEIAAEQERIQGLKMRRGVEISLPIRLKENNWVEIADAVVVMGNRFNLHTYLPHRSQGNIYMIDNTAIPTLSVGDLSKKNFSSAKYNFLWFGSSGLLHKGLDLVLEAFSKIEDAHLWVCGDLESKNEQEFLKVYRKELFHTPNIHPVGFVDVYSDQFTQLINKCGSVILVSCSEGQAGGILNCLKSGLIPLLSQECNTDTDGFGFTLENNSIDEIIKAINKIKNMSTEKCFEMASKAIRVAESRYTMTQFSSNIETVLKKILSQVDV